MDEFDYDTWEITSNVGDPTPLTYEKMKEAIKQLKAMPPIPPPCPHPFALGSKGLVIGMFWAIGKGWRCCPACGQPVPFPK